MSGLAEILAGQRRTGLYTWRAAFDVGDVRDTVEQAGWDFGHVDGWRSLADTKRGLLAEIGEALGFPDHYGQNLDALADCLADLDRDTVLLWDGWSTLARNEEKAFRICLDVLGQRSEQAGRPKFVVLLRGEGPEPRVPLLE